MRIRSLRTTEFILTKHGSLRSKIARRIFVLFILCALIPLSALAYLSFSQVTKELYHQANNRLHQTSKASGMFIFEHLSYLDADLEMLGSNIYYGKSGFLRSPTWKFYNGLKGRFRSLAIMGGGGHFNVLFGEMRRPSLNKDEEEHVRSGKTLLMTRAGTGKFARIFMVRPLGHLQPAKAMLLAEINPEYLWSEDTLSAVSELIVLDESGNVIFSSSPEYLPLSEIRNAMLKHYSWGQFTWTRKGNTYLAGYWTIFMRPRFYNNWVLA
jgi:hypothetical protein